MATIVHWALVDIVGSCEEYCVLKITTKLNLAVLKSLCYFSQSLAHLNNKKNEISRLSSISMKSY